MGKNEKKKKKSLKWKRKTVGPSIVLRLKWIGLKSTAGTKREKIYKGAWRRRNVDGNQSNRSTDSKQFIAVLPTED